MTAKLIEKKKRNNCDFGRIFTITSLNSKYFPDEIMSFHHLEKWEKKPKSESISEMKRIKRRKS